MARAAADVPDPQRTRRTTPNVSDLRTKQLGQIRRAATLVELRLRFARGLRILPLALTPALAVAAGTLAVRKVLPEVLSNRRAWEILAGAAGAVVVALAVAMLRRLPPRVGAVTLDRHHRLHGRLTNALAFDDLSVTGSPASGGAERSPLMEVAIDDACEHAERLDPRRAAPLSLPRDLLGSVAVAAGVVALALLHVPPRPPPEEPHQKQIDAVQLSADDVALFKDAARELSGRDQSPEVKAAVEKFNQLIEDLANKRLDRTEAFRRMEQIERELMNGAEADAKTFEEALKQTAGELQKSDLAKPLAESLDKKNLEQAKKDLKNLAVALRDDKGGKKKVDKAALEKLRQALQKAAAKRKEALAAVNEKRNEVREQLLNKKNQKKDDPDGGPPKSEANPEDERLLKKKERELERLDREAERQQRAQRQLDRLDREMAKAAEDLLHDLGMSADDLEQAAEDINRMQEEQMSDKEKEELRQRLQELRELLRQEGQGGKQRMQRMLKFGKRARGGQGGKGGQKGQPGKDGQQGEDGEEQDGQDGQGKDGEGKDGQGKDGDGQGGMKIGPGGTVLKLVRGSGQGQGQGQGPGDSPGQGSGQAGQGQDSPGGGPGKGIGTSHDPNVMGKRTDMKTGTVDTEEMGQDTKQGPSNSEVILGAAERGFKGSGYKKVFTDYHTRAEEQINKDQVPDGYRFYVHRYFQLIRPRD